MLLLGVLVLALIALGATATSSLANGRRAASGSRVLALAAAARSSNSSSTKPTTYPPVGRCTIHSLPSFTESGETTKEGVFPPSVASQITDIVEVECEPVYAGTMVEISSQELADRCQGGIDWTSVEVGEELEHHHNAITVPLDDDGNATVVLIPSGPCAAGESLITADLLAAPYTTVATSFTVLPPKPTAIGVYAIPDKAVESATTSSVATIIEVEFPPEYAEETVSLNVRQLYSKCHSPHIWWLGATSEVDVKGQSFYTVRLDDDGTAFAVAIGTQSCSAGPVLVEASLEEAPYTTYATTFEIVPPEPTLPEKEFTIEKFQKLEGQPESDYTKKPITGKLGETVDYKVVVKNTGGVSLPLSGLVDPNCEKISAGPAELAPGQDAIFTCMHKLTSVGKWTNVATITGGEEEKHSNEVEVTVIPPVEKITIEKLQKLASEPASTYRKTKIVTTVGETVDYEIIVRNVGEVPEKLTEFTDADCEDIEGGATELAVGAETAFTCHHKLTKVGVWTNVASVCGNSAPPQESNKVEVEAEPEKPEPKPGFRIEKLQRLEPGAEYTKEPLTGKVGQTVEYEIIVKNTGDVKLTFSPLKDSSCENITGGPSVLEPLESATYTCTKKLTEVRIYTNVASIEGNEGTGKKESQEVEVLVPAFTIEKLQRLSGEGEFTTKELTGRVGQTIEYEIIVKNTGATTLKFSKFSDSECEGLIEGAHELPAGGSAVYSCVHSITAPGTYVNVATITGEGVGSKESNTVTVKVPSTPPVPPAPGFTIEKLQRLSGKSEFVTTKLEGKVGETVEYEIKVKNTGDVALSFSEFRDPNCEGIGGGASKLAPGEEATWTCTHKLGSTGEWMNQASVVGSEGTGSRPSNVVVVTAAKIEEKPFKEKEQCKAPNANYVLVGAVGPKTKPFNVSITAKGIKEITFYVGKKKLKTLKASQAKHGVFTVKINPSKLSFGEHKVIVKALLDCEAHLVRSSTFVHTHSSKVSPEFTG